MSTDASQTVQTNGASTEDAAGMFDGLQQVADFNKAHPSTEGADVAVDGNGTNGAAHAASNGMDLGASMLDPDGSRAAARANAADHADTHINGDTHTNGHTDDAARVNGNGNGVKGHQGGDRMDSDDTVQNDPGAGGPPNGNGPPTNGAAADGADTGGAEEPKDPTHITIRVQDNGSEVSFKIKRTTKLGRVMQSFAERTDRTRAVMRFIYDGERVQDDATPESLEMMDDDIIEVHLEQIGGGY